MTDFAQARETMVERQIAGRGIRDANVLGAMRKAVTNAQKERNIWFLHNRGVIDDEAYGFVVDVIAYGIVADLMNSKDG